MTIHSPERQFTGTEQVISGLHEDVQAALLDSDVLDALGIWEHASIIDSLSPKEARRILGNFAV